MCRLTEWNKVPKISFSKGHLHPQPMGTDSRLTSWLANDYPTPWMNVPGFPSTPKHAHHKHLMLTSTHKSHLITINMLAFYSHIFIGIWTHLQYHKFMTFCLLLSCRFECGLGFRRCLPFGAGVHLYRVLSSGLGDCVTRERVCS